MHLPGRVCRQVVAHDVPADDGPDAHAVDDAVVDLGFAVWNTADIYPVIGLDDAVEGLRQMRERDAAAGS